MKMLADKKRYVGACALGALVLQGCGKNYTNSSSPSNVQTCGLHTNNVVVLRGSDDMLESRFDAGACSFMNDKLTDIKRARQSHPEVGSKSEAMAQTTDAIPKARPSDEEVKPKTKPTEETTEVVRQTNIQPGQKIQIINVDVVEVKAKAPFPTDEPLGISFKSGTLEIVRIEPGSWAGQHTDLKKFVGYTLAKINNYELRSFRDIKNCNDLKGILDVVFLLKSDVENEKMTNKVFIEDNESTVYKLKYLQHMSKKSWIASAVQKSNSNLITIEQVRTGSAKDVEPKKLHLPKANVAKRFDVGDKFTIKGAPTDTESWCEKSKSALKEVWEIRSVASKGPWAWFSAKERQAGKIAIKNGWNNEWLHSDDLVPVFKN